MTKLFHINSQTILKPNNFSGMDMSREWKRGDFHQEEENEVDLNLLGRKGLED
jgi:hypothetical protein